MFELVKNLYGGAEVTPPGDNFSFEASGAISEGAVCTATTNGTVVAASDDTSEAYIVAVEEAEEAGDDVRGMYILPGMVFRAPKNDDAHSGAYIGNNSMEMDENGTEVKIDQDPSAASGALTLLNYDDDFAYVTFNKGALFK